MFGVLKIAFYAESINKLLADFCLPHRMLMAEFQVQLSVPIGRKNVSTQLLSLGIK